MALLCQLISALYRTWAVKYYSKMHLYDVCVLDAHVLSKVGGCFATELCFSLILLCFLLPNSSLTSIVSTIAAG